MIEEQRNGRWKVIVDRRSVGQGRICRTVDTEAEATALEAELRAQHRGPDPEGMTVCGLLELYVRDRPDLEAQTHDFYVGMIDRYFRHSWIGAVPFVDLDTAQVRHFYAQLRDGTYLDDNPAAKRARRRAVRPLGERTVKGVANLLSSAYNDAVEAEWIARNPVRGARGTRRGRPAPRPRKVHAGGHSLADIGRILAAGDQDLREVVHLGIVTAGRQAELAALRWKDVDLVAKTIRIDAAIAATRRKDRERLGRWYRKGTKTNDVRVLTLDDGTVEMLTARYARQVEDCRFAGVDPDTLEDRAILSRELEVDYTSPTNLASPWWRACKKAGVAMRFHALRAVAASEMNARGVQVAAATDRTGHASQAVYFDQYGSVRRDVDDPALDALAATWRQIAAT